ncbi:putative fusion protein (N:peptidase-C:desuccinylase) [Desulforapulum autotrophicum HRM2]|uniref:Fusion protein (N:peptidase-C:desuccinylase) n=2 Tax=Desulforapulum autotrophicum TaxID=2296 RepID=C0QH42_DESAH|nr:putative fusion protein (N:peptidase-C:desuccinylase) [Desulforapulum autotrophicum HRM2]
MGSIVFVSHKFSNCNYILKKVLNTLRIDQVNLLLFIITSGDSASFFLTMQMSRGELEPKVPIIFILSLTKSIFLSKVEFKFNIGEKQQVQLCQEYEGVFEIGSNVDVMLKIDSFRQKPGYCGPASLKIVLGYLGVKITEKKLALISGCNPACGIGAEGLVGAAQKLGFRGQVKDFSDLDDIREWVNCKKIPVIVDWFAFEGGHYSVVSGIDTENIYLEDPSLGHRRALKLSTFMRLWFDFPSNYLKSKDELIIRRMIIIDRRTYDERLRKTTGYYAELKKLVAGRSDIRIEGHLLKQRNSETDFYRIVSRDVKPNDRFMIIRAGIHGDEVAGPLTIIRYFNRIFDYAHKRGIKLIIYPLGNPTGYDARQRYNTDEGEGSDFNNDFVRYELENGKLVDDIRRGAKFKRWYLSSDSRLNLNLPAETLLMHHLLRRDPLENIVAALDLHQDNISKIDYPAAYHYAFGDLSVYGRIVEAIHKTVPILAHKVINAGQNSGMRTDREGFIVRHDGTFGDLMYRLGVSYPVTAETTGKTPIETACRVNWLWIKGLVDLVAKKRAIVKRSFSREVVQPFKKFASRHRLINAGRVTTDAGVYPIYAVLTLNHSRDLPRIILSAGIHGEEPAGVYALLEFMHRDLARYLGHFSFMILPCLNPYGFTRCVRYGSQATDLNRSFDNDTGVPEIAAVKDLLHQFSGPYRLAVDLHETDTYMPRGKAFLVEDIPAGFYMYETTPSGRPVLGPAILKALHTAGYPITKRQLVYDAECRNGLITSISPNAPDYPAQSEFNGTLDWYMLKKNYTQHSITTETPTAWPLRRRIAAHRKALIHALNNLKKNL